MNSSLLKNQGEINKTIYPNRMNSSLLKNQGEINKTIPFRRIRIIVSDPYATDSTDDEYDHRRPAMNSSPKRRRIVHEIIIPYDDAGEKPSREGPGEMSEANLGTFGSPEEASRVFEAKKVEFRERLEAESATDSSSQSFLLNDDAGEKSSGEGSDRTNLMRFRGVRRRKSGRWSAEIGVPIKKRKVFLGVFGTAEEASRSYEAKKVEFRKRQEAQYAVERAPPSNDACEKLRTNSDEIIRPNLKRFRGVRQRRKSGRWTAEIRDPFYMRRIFLGSFGTAEEASRVFEAKKVEFRERQGVQSAMDRYRIGCGSGTDSANQSGETIEAEMNLGSILIDNNGFLLGEFSNLDDDLTISD